MEKFAGYLVLALIIWVAVSLDTNTKKTVKKKSIKRKSSYKLFDEEAKALGLDEQEKEECLKAGITPEEWAEENDPNFKK